MSFIEKNGSYEVKLANGDVVRFESEEEMRAAKEYDESIQELLGHVVERPGAAASLPGEKKKVRITIDPDVEFVGAERDTSSTASGPPSPTGKAKRKALA
jgi:hypothetical protein